MPTPHMEFCLHLIYGSQLLQPLQLPAAHHMELLEEKSEVEEWSEKGGVVESSEILS
ncbi:Tyramine beta-hydroxylase [Clarias magur]|uniref:Tyramine beta-hydroxylase n=1 Tax=Clarias magur TaxID=1594786 RepID=A0A8J4XAE3_CLAMG|nr:Tyramine beta-hydroxylase [Clarias magur]